MESVFACRRPPYLMLALFFSLTTPSGVALGLGIKSIYNDKSPAALAVSGAFDSVSTGILVYMALVRKQKPQIFKCLYFMIQCKTCPRHAFMCRALWMGHLASL